MQPRNRHLLRNWVILIALLVFIFFAAKRYWDFLRSPVNKEGDVKAFVVLKGEGSSSIADRLEEEGLIRSALVFKIFLKRANSKVEAGSFKISPAMSVDEIIKVLQKGSIDKWVTLIEGWRVEEIAEKLNKELGIKKDDFIKVSKEGYMFPDTYLFNHEATANTIASILRDTFEQKYDESSRKRVKKLGLSEAEGVILASIVEREARSFEARQKIASILLKRLKIDMGLNVDATIQYALGYQEQEKSWWKRHLTKEDLKIESPYNTYLYRGLPPKPISNPSLASIKAVAEADPSTPYLYYYHDSKGNSYYAKTLDEHNENVANNP